MSGTLLLAVSLFALSSLPLEARAQVNPPQRLNPATGVPLETD